MSPLHILLITRDDLKFWRPFVYAILLLTDSYLINHIGLDLIYIALIILMNCIIQFAMYSQRKKFNLLMLE